MSRGKTMWLLMLLPLLAFGQGLNLGLPPWAPPQSVGIPLDTTNLVGAWMWQGGSLTDLSGNGNNVTLTTSGGFPSAAAGYPIGGYSYNNADVAYGNAGTGASLNPTAITVEAWVNFSSFSATSGNAAVVTKESGSAFNLFYVTTTGQLAVFLACSVENPNYDGGTFTLTLNKWYFIAYTYSSATGLIGYVGSIGTPAAQDAATGTGFGTLLSNSGSTEIGNQSGTSGRNPTATIGAVYIYNVAQTQSAIQYDQTVTTP